MKKGLLLSAALGCIFTASAQVISPYASGVLEFQPAPGQYTNTTIGGYFTGDNTPAKLVYHADSLVANKQKSALLSLGAYGGYITVGFDHTIPNGHSYDFKVYGNMFAGNSEPGIVMVSKDTNGNGKPDDTWYELAGSVDASLLKTNYQITYYRPDSTKANVTWKDNLGNTGTVDHNGYHSQAYYPLTVTADTLSFTGTLLPQNVSQNGSSYSLTTYAWGYADNQPNTSYLSDMKIDWAVDADRNPVSLDGIDFVRVYTGVNQKAGWLGEISTEFSTVEDLHQTYYTLDVNGLLSSSNSTFSTTKVDQVSGYYNESHINQSAFHLIHYWSSWGFGGGFTYTNSTDVTTTTYDNLSCIAGKGAMEDTYLTCNTNDYTPAIITFNDGTTHNVLGAYFNNATYAYYSMLNGDGYANKFATGDYFRVKIVGYDASGDSISQVKTTLADYTATDEASHTINKDWKWVDLTGLGSGIAKLKFTIDSSNSGTPTYFCMDGLMIDKVDGYDVTAINETNVDNTDGSKSVGKVYYSDGSLHLNGLSGSSVEVYNISGQLVDQIKVTEANETVSVQAPAGIYLVRANHQGTISTYKINIK